jgi:hypothetical protein
LGVWGAGNRSAAAGEIPINVAARAMAIVRIRAL